MFSAFRQPRQIAEAYLRQTPKSNPNNRLNENPLLSNLSVAKTYVIHTERVPPTVLGQCTSLPDGPHTSSPSGKGNETSAKASKGSHNSTKLCTIWCKEISICLQVPRVIKYGKRVATSKHGNQEGRTVYTRLGVNLGCEITTSIR